jgi:hypothetical protein
MPQPQPTGFLTVPGAANSIGAGVGRDKEKDQASIALRTMQSVRSMARLWDGPGMGQRSAGGAGAREGEQEGGAGEPAHIGGEEADAAERCVPGLVALVICCEWGEWGECGGAADVDGGGGDTGWAWVYPPHSLCSLHAHTHAPDLPPLHALSGPLH